MADVITRLKLESSEFDSKIKRATQGLLQMEQDCRKVGGTLGILENDQKQFVQALGSMQTVATTTRGKLAELTQAYTELSIQYKRLTDEEKNGDYGKALRSSLDQLKTRIGDTQGQLKNVSNELHGGFSNALDQVAGKFGLNIRQLTSWGAALGAATGALQVAKDAFFASESTVDEWGRTMASAKSLYTGFLTAINNSDISGFLGRMDQIVQAARAAYNELDTLGTMRTIQSPQMSAQQTENERMRMMIQTRRYIAPTDGRKASMQNGQLLTDAQIKRLEQQLQNGMQSLVSLNKNEIGQTTNAINAFYDKAAKENGMSQKEFREGTKSWAEFSKRLEGYQKYLDFEREHTTSVSMSTSVGRVSYPLRDSAVNPYEQYRNWGTFRVDDENGTYHQLVNLIRKRDQQAGQTYSLQAQGFRAINRAEGITPRGVMPGGRGGGSESLVSGGMKGVEQMDAVVISTTESMKVLQAQLAAYQQKLATATNMFDAGEAQAGIEMTQKRIEAQPLAIRLGLDTDSIVEMQDNFNTLMDDMRANMQPLDVAVNFGNGKNIAKDAKTTEQAWKAASQAITSAGSALQNIEDPAAKVAGIVMQAIAQIALGFAQATASPATGAAGVWGWIAAVTAGLATMTATIASVKSATKGGFAEGGIVPGTSFSGDSLRASDYGINSGELILNRAQQNSLAAQLETDNALEVSAQPYVSGELIYLGLKPYLRRLGRGELITSRR